MNSQKPVILAAARTPIGKFGGAFSELAAPDLGVVASQAALARAEIAPDEVQVSIFGQVYQGGSGMNPARQVGIRAGVPEGAPAMTINQVCASGLQAVALAAQYIRLGEVDVALAGGMESMSQAPYVLPGARWGSKMGHAKVVDTLLSDGLWDAFANCHMATTADTLAQEYGISRKAQDEYAHQSQQRYAAARRACFLSAEVVPVSVPQRRGAPRVISDDEYPRPDTDLDALASLRPAFKGRYHHHRRQRFRHQRRRGRNRGGVRRMGESAQATAARHPQCGHDHRRSAGTHGHRAGKGNPTPPGIRPVLPSTTLTFSRSTKPSPRKCCQWKPNSTGTAHA